MYVCMHVPASNPGILRLTIEMQTMTGRTLVPGQDVFAEARGIFVRKKDTARPQLALGIVGLSGQKVPRTAIGPGETTHHGQPLLKKTFKAAQESNAFRLVFFQQSLGTFHQQGASPGMKDGFPRCHWRFRDRDFPSSNPPACYSLNPSIPPEQVNGVPSSWIVVPLDISVYIYIYITNINNSDNNNHHH